MIKQQEFKSEGLSGSGSSDAAPKYKFKSIWKDLKYYISYHKFALIIISVLVFIEVAITVISPKIAGGAITELSHGAGHINFENLFSTLCLLCVFYSGVSFSSCMSGYLISHVSLKFSYRLREDISKKISKLPINYIETSSTGDILSRIINDVETLSSSLTRIIKETISSSIMIIGSLSMMFFISSEITWILLALLLAAVIIIILILKNTQKYFSSYQENLGNLDGCIEESFSGYNVIKIFHAEESIQKKFCKINNLMKESAWKSEFFSGLASPLMGLIFNLNYLIACIMGGYYAVVRGMAIGDISAFIVYSGQFTQPLIQAAGMSGVIQHMLAAAKRVFEFLNASEEPLDKFANDTCVHGKEIEFKNVSFEYNAGEKVLNNISFKITKGQTVALVGETGSGKTTLIKLLMRFYELSEGEILFDGVNINNLDLQKFRRLFGVVTQDSWVCNGNIMENIRYGNLKSTDAEVKEAAKIVSANHFIDTLPEGYGTVINESTSNISEGQKQMICIARAVISNPEILILDEATGSVDVCTEKRIQESLNKILEGHTSIIIAHRLSTIKNADVVMVLEKGRIIECGSHLDLMDKKGAYYNLYSSQFEC